MSNFLYVDVATAPLANAVEYLDAPEPDGRLKDPDKIAEDIAKKRQGQLDKAALDPDLARISGIAWMWATESEPFVRLCKEDGDEADTLSQLATEAILGTVFVGYNARSFDWRMLMRRALYLDVPFPRINVDKYRGANIDVLDKLTDNGVGTMHSLQFYCRRFGWTDLCKSLTGAEESRVFESGKWDELEQSLRHDVLAMARLAQKLKLVG